MTGGEGAGSKPCSRVADPRDFRTQQEIGRERTGSKPGSRLASPDPLRQQAVYLHAVFSDAGGLYDVRVVCYFGFRPYRYRIALDGCIPSLLAVASGYCFCQFRFPSAVPSRWQLNGSIAFLMFYPTVASSGARLGFSRSAMYSGGRIGVRCQPRIR